MPPDSLATCPTAVLSPGTRAVVGISARVQGRTSTLDVEALYRRYGDMVLGRCRTLLGNDADAQETAQEIFLKLHRYRNRFRGEASPATYLFKVTTTTCLNKLRSRRRRPEDPVEDFPTIPYHDASLAPYHVRDLLEKVLQIADETTQKCVVLHYMDGMTYDEVG
ncbi:MAG: RNA polymerase sigma factor, partial [Deltaproteobacteria bacterium]|nr:RNA polymerase sigma factor [Deltaproteobacteria bacterium]